ncbi:MAG: amidohydrolase family protein, partial [Oscillospiraceae bacterium]
MKKYPCPCCGRYTLEEEPPGTFEICPDCGWEDDRVQFRDPDYEEAANTLSLHQAREQYRDTHGCIFYHGTILTMEKKLLAEAVLVRDGIIKKVGTLVEAQKAAPRAALADLHGKTMLPAFMDAHGHFSSYANAQLQVPLENAASFAEIAEAITAFISENSLSDGEWIVAKGYDHNTLLEKSHPTVEFLDETAPRNPLVLQHQSGHCGVLNSMALNKLKLSPKTPNPPGGVIGKAKGKLTGYLEEDAYISCIKQVPMAPLSAMLGAYRKAQGKYLSQGITTVQEGMMVAQMLPLYQALLESGLLVVDVVGYCEPASMAALKKALPASQQKYDRHFKIGGYKIFLDGSPQVRTAWMKTPYQNSESCGYGTMESAAVLAAVEQAAAEKTQILAHCNGDAAAQQYLDAIAEVEKRNKNLKNLKPVMIHAQLLDREQLPQVAALGVIPSFFVAHILHWGDIHINNFGFDRAQWISPAHSAQKLGIPFTFHQDTPVIEPNMLETLECSVLRKTKSQAILGESERLTVLDAIKAVTIHTAFQYSEE